MTFLKRNRLAIATIVYWFLLSYIVAALIFWFIELQSQNNKMTAYKMSSVRREGTLGSQAQLIRLEQQRKSAQYIGEGITFLLLFLAGAIFVYLPVRRQVKLQQQEQNFMMAVTHELKTPLAITKLNLETLQKHSLDGEKRLKIIGSSLQEINRLNTLVNNILISAQLEGGAYQLLKDELDFSALTLGVYQDFKSRFPGRHWEADIEPELPVNGDLILLQLLVNNLVDNAIKYGGLENMTAVRLSKENDRVVLRVFDRGPGIPATEKKKIFQKFYRIGSEQTRTSQGTGLGLYLCKKIAADHHASVSVMDNSPKGSIFMVIF